MESGWKAEIATLSIKQEETRGHRKEENRTGRVQMIRNMVLGSIKCESISLCAIIFSDVKTLNHFSRNYVFTSAGTIIA
jgi:hypothetical protein